MFIFLLRKLLTDIKARIKTSDLTTNTSKAFSISDMAKVVAAHHCIFCSPEMNPTEVFHIDHLHPRNHFSKKYLERLDYVANSPENLSFYESPEHWDTIPNLHLLNHSQNISKQDISLKQWLSHSSNNYTPSMLLVSDENIEFSRFPDFYNERRSALKQRLLNRVFLTTK